MIRRHRGPGGPRGSQPQVPARLVGHWLLVRPSRAARSHPSCFSRLISAAACARRRRGACGPFGCGLLYVRHHHPVLVVETDMLRRMTLFVLAGLTLASLDPSAQKYKAADGHIRVALAKQPFSPTRPSKGPATTAE